MFEPDPSEVLLPGEPAKVLLAIYDGILVESALDNEAPTVLDCARAWEKAKVVWRIRRLGADSEEAREAYAAARMHERANLVSRSQTWRTSALKSCVDNLKALDDAFDQVQQYHRAALAPGLRLVNE